MIIPDEKRKWQADLPFLLWVGALAVWSGVVGWIFIIMANS